MVKSDIEIYYEQHATRCIAENIEISSELYGVDFSETKVNKLSEFFPRYSLGLLV